MTLDQSNYDQVTISRFHQTNGSFSKDFNTKVLPEICNGSTWEPENSKEQVKDNLNQTKFSDFVKKTSNRLNESKRDDTIVIRTEVKRMKPINFKNYNKT